MTTSHENQEYVLNVTRWVIDHAFSIKMAGYWPSFFFFVFMDQDGVEVHKLAKKERGQYPAILIEKACSIKDLLFGFRGNFSRGTQRVVPSGQDSSFLPAWVAKSDVFGKIKVLSKGLIT